MPGGHGRRPEPPSAAVPGRPRSATALAVCAVAMIATGCGAAPGGTGAQSEDLPLSVEAPPTASACGFDDGVALREAAALRSGPAAATPLPGAYRYATHGVTSDPDAAGGVRALPGRTTAVVTPARTAAGLRCFGRRHRLAPYTDAANVYVVRGQDVYVVGVGIATPHLVERVTPRPAILGASDTETRWSGAFRGPTSGTYAVEVLGRRRIRVGDRVVSAVGVRSTAIYRGQVTGEQVSRSWVTPGRSLVVAESARSALRIGGAEERLRYRSRLLSLLPDPGKEG